jgi:hypothetical protein
MPINHQNTQPDPLRILVESVEASLYPKLLDRLRSDLLATKAEANPTCVMLSLADAGERYGIGRIAIKQMIRAGRIRAVERPCRGGRVGQFLHLADCERVLAGRKP